MVLKKYNKKSRMWLFSKYFNFKVYTYTWARDITRKSDITLTLRPTSRKCTISSSSNQVLPKREWPSANLNTSATCFSLAEQESQQSISPTSSEHTSHHREQFSFSRARTRKENYFIGVRTLVFKLFCGKMELFMHICLLFYVIFTESWQYFTSRQINLPNLV